MTNCVYLHLNQSILEHQYLSVCTTIRTLHNWFSYGFKKKLFAPWNTLCLYIFFYFGFVYEIAVEILYIKSHSYFFYEFFFKIRNVTALKESQTSSYHLRTIVNQLKLKLKKKLFYFQVTTENKLQTKITYYNLPLFWMELLFMTHYDFW